MGIGMAAMAAAGSAVPATFWAWLFGLPALGLLLAALTPTRPAVRAHRLHHALGALAMTYMALAMAGSPAHAHHGAATGMPVVTGTLLLYFGGYTLWAGSRLLSTTGARSSAVLRACRRRAA